MKQAFKKWMEHKWLWLVASLLEVGFIVSLLFAFQAMLTRIFDILQTLSSMTKSIADASDLIEQEAAYAALASSQSFFEAYKSLLLAIVGLVLILFAVWCIFQGTLWLMAKRMHHDKLSTRTYMKQWMITTCIAYLMVLLAIYAGWYLSLLNTRIVVPLFSRSIVTTMVIGVAFVVFALLILFYAKLPKKVQLGPDSKKVLVALLRSSALVGGGLVVLWLFFELANTVFAMLSGSTGILAMLGFFGVALLLIVVAIIYGALMVLARQHVIESV